MSNQAESANWSPRLCVFCASAEGHRPEFAAEARSLGGAMAAAGWGLVYGGAVVGMMGAVADAALAGGAEVIGVIPRQLVEKEVAHAGLTSLRIVGSMHERKALMASLADAFVALPGGFGTLDEFMEILTWAQLRIHAKPCVLVNTLGYYDGLLCFLEHAVDEGFLKAENLALILVVRDAAEAMSVLREQVKAGPATPAAQDVNQPVP